MMKIITFFLLLLLISEQSSSQSFLKEDYRAGFQSVELKATSDGGYVVAGVILENGIEVRKYDASRALEWVKSIFPDSIPYYNTVVGTQMVPMDDGSLIVSADLFECDVLSGNYLMRLSADGNTIYWKKILNFYEQILPATDSTFLRSNGWNTEASDFEIWHKNGYLLPNTLSGTWPDFRLSLNEGGNWICASGAKVYRANWAGVSIGLPWFAPEGIRQVDTLTNGGFVALGTHTAYFLDNDLVLTAIKQLSPEADQMKIKACSKGFVGMHNWLAQKIYTYNFDFQEIGAYSLNATFTQPDFVAREDTFFWVGRHDVSDQHHHLWVLSDTTGLAGVWNTGNDIEMTEIAFEGEPSGTVFTTPLPWFPGQVETVYSANYTRVFVTVKNTGNETIQHCNILSLWRNICGDFCSNLARMKETTFDNLQLAPGESRVLDLDTLEIVCTDQNLNNLCLTVTEVDRRREKNALNSTHCVHIPDLFLSTAEPGMRYFSVVPNPATDMLRIDFPDDLATAQYAIYAVDGRIVQKGSCNYGVPVPVGDLHRGVYWVALSFVNGQYGRSSFVKAE